MNASVPRLSDKLTYPVARLGSVFLLLSMLLCGIGRPHMSWARGDDSFDKALAMIESRRGLDEPLAEQEEAYLALLTTDRSPAEKGRVYAAITTTYSRSPARNYEAIIKYSRLALAQPLGVLASIDMWGALGNALKMKVRAEDASKPPHEMRPDLTRPFLQALRVISDNLTIRKKMKIPSVRPYRAVMPDSPAARRYFKKEKERYEKQLAAANAARLQNDLLLRRKWIMRACISPYLKEPLANDELRELAEEILTKKHRDTTEELIAKLERRIERRREALKPQTPKSRQEKKGPKKRKRIRKTQDPDHKGSK